MNKDPNAYKTIGEVVKILDLKSRSGQKTPTHTIRYWEKEFKQIKPKILSGKRRYYDRSNIDLLKKIKFLLKDKGLTIKGVKNVLKSDINELDDYNSDSLKASYYKHNFKLKSLKILNKLKKLKKYGKKNTY